MLDKKSHLSLLQFGKQHMVPTRDWDEDLIVREDEDDDEFKEDLYDAPHIKKKKVVMPRTRRSNEL